MNLVFQTQNCFNGSCGLQFRLRLICFIQQIDFYFISNLRRRHLLYTLHVTGARLTSVCGRYLTYTLITYQLPMYTLSLSALIQSKKLFMCSKGVGAVSHRETIVSATQMSCLPSSCAWPVSLGSFGLGGMCECMFGWVFV